MVNNIRVLVLSNIQPGSLIARHPCSNIEKWNVKIKKVHGYKKKFKGFWGELGVIIITEYGFFFTDYLPVNSINDYFPVNSLINIFPVLFHTSFLLLNNDVIDYSGFICVLCIPKLWHIVYGISYMFLLPVFQLIYYLQKNFRWSLVVLRCTPVGCLALSGYKNKYSHRVVASILTSVIDHKSIPEK